MLALPSDCLAKVCAFLRARETVLLTGLGTSVLEALESDAFLWGEAVRREHGGLKLAPADARCRYARCALRTLAALRLFRERVLGGGEPLAFRGLATDGGVDDGQMAYWVDALFRPEPWFVYSSAATRRLVLCAAVFEGDAPDASRDDDRDWMLERLRVAGRLLGDDFLENGLDAEPPLALELTFYEIARAMDAQGWLREMVRDVRDPDAQAAALGAIRARCDAVEAAAAGRGDAVGTLDDGEIPPRWREPPFGDVSVESAGGVDADGAVAAGAAAANAAAAAATPSTAIATGLVVRRPASYSCPARTGVLFGCRRCPEPRDLRDGGPLRRRIAAAAADVAALAPSLVGDDALAAGFGAGAAPDGEDDAPGFSVGSLGAAVRTTRGPEGDVVELVGDDDDADFFPVAVFAFYDKAGVRARRRGERERGAVEAALRFPRAVRGLVVALVDAEDRMAEFGDDHAEPNVDMEFVGVRGYSYAAGDCRDRPPVLESGSCRATLARLRAALPSA